MGYTIGELISTVSNSGRPEDVVQVWNAYEVAKRAHSRQRRASGDRYITHPVAVAGIVAAHGGAVPAVCAALLHDVVEDAGVSSTLLHAEFGSGVAGMVDALTRRVIRDDGGHADPDLALITIADRLHNLRTIGSLRAQARKRASLDTLVFHVPLAHRLHEPATAAELTRLACATLDSLDDPDLRERRRRVTRDPRAAERLAALLRARRPDSSSESR